MNIVYLYVNNTQSFYERYFIFSTTQEKNGEPWSRLMCQAPHPNAEARLLSSHLLPLPCLLPLSVRRTAPGPWSKYPTTATTSTFRAHEYLNSTHKNLKSHSGTLEKWVLLFIAQEFFQVHKTNVSHPFLLFFLDTRN